MEKLISYIVNSLVEFPDEVNITETAESEKVTVYQVKVRKEDMGRIIGKNGKIASSIRAIVKSVSGRSGKKIVIKFDEN